ncbi:hypothetical protein MJO28_002472 [Puccinia striiformis f. sp. tritici]|uniref:Uncharacterized protein n=1 Tax=Puccinia striiformis f. sp. tritici TaxID=168172 RepID=A0ACC0ES22_9BASI|nr:hypothetical protein MJO28_002472 [Puccinia striiformis f. sp. tritici]
MTATEVGLVDSSQEQHGLRSFFGWNKSPRNSIDVVTDWTPPIGIKYNTVPANSGKLQAVLVAKDNNALSTVGKITNQPVRPPIC